MLSNILLHGEIAAVSLALSLLKKEKKTYFERSYHVNDRENLQKVFHPFNYNSVNELVKYILCRCR